ncbi:MAG: hypothetical protein Q9190_000572 [Brigantiaea leucoxantha]
MFSPLNLFKDIQCPEYPRCALSKCIFAHKDKPQSGTQDVVPRKTSAPHKLEPGDEQADKDAPRKRRRISPEVDKNLDIPNGFPTVQPPGQATPKLSYQHKATPMSVNDNGRSLLPLNASKSVSSSPRKISHESRVGHSYGGNGGDINALSIPRRSASPSISKGRQEAALSRDVGEESLNPRLLPNPPASHPIRLKLIKMLHEQLSRLNESLRSAQDTPNKELLLSDADLITEALDEEESIAKKSSSVYLNVIKSRIMVLKKMKVEAWKEGRAKKLAAAKPVNKLPPTPKAIETDLTAEEELAFLPRLAAVQLDLRNHGYVVAAPAQAEVEQARKGVEASLGYEQCDRCKTRFQVFPGRREEDGALTSPGTCTYHWAKPRRPEMIKGDNKARDLMYACCNQPLGQTGGCTEADCHVFKISDPKRLALVVPFEPTPDPEQFQKAQGAVCFDCEMGYTTLGLELIRLTATSWPDGKELLDVLVRPKGEILDLNSRFSGVRPRDYTMAIPYDTAVAKNSTLNTSVPPPLRLVDSPEAARKLLFDLLTPDTPLIGHALENDLNAARMLHPVIVDTCLLFPHPRGLPMRLGLKALMKKHLNRDIQISGDQGHDSMEDARAAGDLVRYKIGLTWKKMKWEGWTIQNGEFCPPVSSAPAPEVASSKIKESTSQ